MGGNGRAAAIDSAAADAGLGPGEIYDQFSQSFGVTADRFGDRLCVVCASLPSVSKWMK